jgi:hypothetical protein
MKLILTIILLSGLLSCATSKGGHCEAYSSKCDINKDTCSK